MRLVLRSSVREHHGDFVVRESRWGASVLWLVFTVLGVAWTSAPLLDAGALWFGPLFGLPCLLVAGFTARGVVLSWRAGWWILRVRRDGLVLRLRSQLNRDLPDEWANVVVLERQDVRSVIAERASTRGQSGSTFAATASVRLSFELARPIPAEVLRSIERECDPRIRGRTHFHTRIASVDHPNVLSITWSGPSIGLKPRLRATLRELERLGFPVEREVRTVTPDRTSATFADGDQRIVELARAGEKLRAIALWRAAHGGTLADAKAQVEQLSTRSAA